ncbi:DUF1376 domain-containing protein [Danxiaibacter flavus]|uniref:DUF1376 domain-containing protein n=1 Tax=Danxiaibacter flavus TaxID=3049108 RepID=A0ABV3ZIC5_9BACT|nr:DUF1376 domain-containing protein [Chitinophagaceae bacterium DXS]
MPDYNRIWFPLYVSDYLSDSNVQSLTMEEEGVYVRLLTICWKEDGIPNDRERLRLLCKGVKAKVIENVMRLFYVDANDNTKLRNKRLEKEKEKAAKFKQLQSEKGIASAKKRKQKMFEKELMQAGELLTDEAAECMTENEPRLNFGCNSVDVRYIPQPNLSQSQSHSHRERETERDLNPPPQVESESPTIQQVKEAFFLKRPVHWTPQKTTQEAEKFFYHYESVGWVINGQLIKLWQARVPVWISNDANREQFKSKSSEVPTAQPKIVIA